MKEEKPLWEVIRHDDDTNNEKYASKIFELLDEVLRSNSCYKVENAQALGELGPVAKPISQDLRKALTDRDIRVRVTVALALWQIEGKGEEFLQIIESGLDDPDLYTKAAACCGLVINKFLPDCPKAIPLLIRMLSSENLMVRHYGCSGLRQFGNRAREALPSLRKLVESDPCVENRKTAAEAIVAIIESEGRSIKNLSDL